MCSVFIKKDDDWCFGHSRGWRYKWWKKFVCVFSWDAVFALICLIIHWPLWNEWSQLLTNLTSLPISCGCFHRAWVHTLSHSSVCLFRVIVCWHVCREPARLMFLHAFLRNANTFILFFFFGMNLFVILSASPCSTFVPCCTEMISCQSCLALRCETHKRRRCTLIC